MEVTPLLPPPPGTAPNFVNPENSAYETYVAAGICLSLMLLFPSARVYAKLKLIRGRTLDDCIAPAFTYIDTVLTRSLDIHVLSFVYPLC